MRQDIVIDNMEPAEKVDCVINVTISEKKTKGAIRMNINFLPMSKGALLTKYNVPLPQKV